jgi:hypothetical protein
MRADATLMMKGVTAWYDSMEVQTTLLALGMTSEQLEMIVKQFSVS